MKRLGLYGAILAVSAALFLWLPEVDLAVSGWFYDPGHGFPLESWAPIRGLEGSIRWITIAIALLVIAGAGWLRLTGRPFWRLDRKALIFLAVATALGPGILVNTVFKDHWGRARPYQVAQFGGDKSFTAAPLPADQCARNCSFASGHAALGFSLVGFAFLLPAGRRRDIVFGGAVGFGALVGLARIASGHHFLSDIVYAALIVVATSWLLHRWLVVHDGATPIIAAIGRVGETPHGRRALWLVALVSFEPAAIVWLDRPIADFFHRYGTAQDAFFHSVERFGIGYPYLVVTGLAFAVLRWGDRWQRLRRFAPAMHAAAIVPGFIFAAIAASGLAVDIIKVVVGRARPRLLFANGAYGFGWFGWSSDDWSFPSGHAATAAAVVTALWCLWPRPFYLYIGAAALVALSRVWTGAHYPSDVIAGAAIAVAVTRALAVWLAPRRAVKAEAETDAAPQYRAV